MADNDSSLVESPTKRGPEVGLDRIDLARAFNEQPPPLDFVLPGLLSGTVGALVAQGGAGKSWLALEAAIAVAGGPDLLRLGIETHGPVLYLAAEDPRTALLHRLHALAPYLDLPAREVVVDGLELVPHTGGVPIDLLDADAGWPDALVRLAEGRRLVVLDTLRRFHGADENSAGEMSRLLGILERVCARTGAAVLFLHHTAKASALNGGGDQQQASRGSSVLVDNVRGGQINLIGMTDAEARERGVEIDARRTFVRLVQAKANFAALGEERWFERGAGGVLLPKVFEQVQEAGGAGQGQQQARWRRGA